MKTEYTVQELIEELSEIKDKSKKVKHVYDGLIENVSVIHEYDDMVIID